MKTKAATSLCVATVLLSGLGGAARFAAGTRPAGIAFDELRLRFEVDLPAAGAGIAHLLAAGSPLGLPAEVVLEAAAPSGFSDLRLRDAAGNVLLHLEHPSGTALGISELALECEGATLGDALEAFPPGEYVVEGLTVDGLEVQGRVQLREEFPGLFAVVAPLPGATVPAGDVTLAWTPARGAARYTLEVEQEELGFALEVSLPAWQTSFTVPAAMLQSGLPYEYSLAVQGDTDNELELEGGFVTAGGGVAGTPRRAPTASR